MLPHHPATLHSKLNSVMRWHCVDQWTIKKVTLCLLQTLFSKWLSLNWQGLPKLRYRVHKSLRLTSEGISWHFARVGIHWPTPSRLYLKKCFFKQNKAFCSFVELVGATLTLHSENACFDYLPDSPSFQRAFIALSHSVQLHVRIVSQLGHYHFQPEPSKFVIHPTGWHCIYPSVIDSIIK